MGEHSQEDFEGLAKLVKLQNDLNQKREDLEAEWLETSEALA